MTRPEVARSQRESARQGVLDSALRPGRVPGIEALARHGTAWHPREHRALIGRLESSPPSVAARRLGRTTMAVTRKLARLGISPRRVRLSAEGLQLGEVADTLGVTVYAVEHWTRKTALPVEHVLVGKRHYRVITPDALLDWLFDRGALYSIAPADLAWREIVQEAKASLNARLVLGRVLCDCLAVSPSGLRWRVANQGFPDIALSLYRLGNYFSRPAVTAWLDSHDAWTAAARSVIPVQAAC